MLIFLAIFHLITANPNHDKLQYCSRFYLEEKLMNFLMVICEEITVNVHQCFDENGGKQK